MRGVIGVNLKKKKPCQKYVVALVHFHDRGTSGGRYYLWQQVKPVFKSTGTYSHTEIWAAYKYMY